MIRFEDVSFGYGESSTIHGVSFHLAEGSFTAVIGANGAGKSTISKLIRGLLRPTGGRVLYRGQDLNQMKPSALASGMGFLFQNPDRQLCRNTVRDELLFTLRLTVPDESRHDELCSAVMDALSLRPDADPMTMSRGEKQRVALASALVHKPELLILDEPTTGLDYRECTQMMDCVAGLNAGGTTVVMVCHDMELVLDWSREVLVMNAGNLVAAGSTAAILSDAEVLKKASLLPPQMLGLGAMLGGRFEGIATVDGMADAIEEEKGAAK